MKISVLFDGELHDSGFNQCALDGVRRLQQDPGKAEIEVISGVPYETNDMSLALRQAAECSDGVVFIGGQGNRVMPEVAPSFADRAFAVVQGNVTGPNLASYDVLQEHSAFLAGVLAARLTQTGVVGHLSGHRVVPGLKGRAAFAAGVAYADSSVRLVTGFCGTQDDSAVTEAWGRAMAGQGADHLFTMLNAARDGATHACRGTGMRQIGNAADWCEIEPDTFVGSAVARIDLGVERAVADMQRRSRPEKIVHLGLRDKAVSLSLVPDVPQNIRQEIEALAHRISDSSLTVRTDYEGPEFEATL